MNGKCTPVHFVGLYAVLLASAWALGCSSDDDGSSATGSPTGSGTGTGTSATGGGAAEGGGGSGGTTPTGGGGSGGTTPTGGGGSGGTGGAAANILWTDEIQTTTSLPWGFDGAGVEHPIGTAVQPNDANGANLSRELDPAGGTGFAMRHFGLFDDDGARSQAGLWSFANAAFGQQAKSAEGVYVAQQWYFPKTYSAGQDPYPWLNLWDWHATEDGGTDRWHTSPGLMLAEDGSMLVRWEWGGEANSINPTSSDSTIALPVGEWFDIEMYYRWATANVTLTLWINGEQALQQAGVQTCKTNHVNVEMYTKFYGSSNTGPAWSPTPIVRYTRNVRVSDQPIWQ